MNYGTTFLTDYGLQNYVSYSRSQGRNIFSIEGSESPKMIDHARHIISEMFGRKSTILVN